MKLYSFRHSPNPLKVRLTLAELNIDYECEEVVLFKGEQHQQKFLQINPLGKVPVLCDGYLTLRESNAIICYLGREYGRSLWPNDIKSESSAMQWLFYESAHMASPFGSIWFNQFGLSKMGKTPLAKEQMAEYYERAEGALNHLNQHLSSHQYILGNTFTLVDCSLGTTIASLKETLLAHSSQWPAVTRYMNSIIERQTWIKAQGNAIFDKL